MLRARGFTLLEIVIAVSIMLIIFALSIPSLRGVVADRRLRRSLDSFNNLVRLAEEHSVGEHRAYLLVWGEKNVVLRPEAFAKDEEFKPTAQFSLERGDVLTLALPSALANDPPAEWIFWPSGICEPAVVRFKGRDGTWAANYSPLTGRPELISYAAR
jgi:prepilin-type N-terminal cleavage/methylation domain-containing protein